MANELENMLNAGFTGIPNALLEHYADVGLNNDDLALVLQINKAHSKLIKDLSIPKLARTLHISEYVVKQRVNRLLNNDWLAILGKGAEFEYFDLSPLYKKIATKDFVEYSFMEESTIKEDSIKELLAYIEQKFSRPLSYQEIQTVQIWLFEDQCNFVQIKCAIDEAIIQNAISIKYIDKILKTWQQKGLKTKEAIEKDKARFRDEKYRRAQEVKKEIAETQKTTVPKVNLKDIDLSLLEKLKAGNK